MSSVLQYSTTVFKLSGFECEIDTANHPWRVRHDPSLEGLEGSFTQNATLFTQNSLDTIHGTRNSQDMR